MTKSEVLSKIQAINTRISSYDAEVKRKVPNYLSNSEYKNFSLKVNNTISRNSRDYQNYSRSSDAYIEGLDFTTYFIEHEREAAQLEATANDLIARFSNAPRKPVRKNQWLKDGSEAPRKKLSNSQKGHLKTTKSEQEEVPEPGNY